jgi:transposase
MAKEPGVASESLRRWSSQHEVDAGKREGLTTAQREELNRLRRENRILKQDAGTHGAEPEGSCNGRTPSR